jgi:hypothetical protein
MKKRALFETADAVAASESQRQLQQLEATMAPPGRPVRRVRITPTATAPNATRSLDQLRVLRDDVVVALCSMTFASSALMNIHARQCHACEAVRRRQHIASLLPFTHPLPFGSSSSSSSSSSSPSHSSWHPSTTPMPVSSWSSLQPLPVPLIPLSPFLSRSTPQSQQSSSLSVVPPIWTARLRRCDYWVC